MQNASTSSAYAYPDATGPTLSGPWRRYLNPDRHHPAMPLRIRVFLRVLLLSLALGLGINFSRPAIYQATARVQITPAEKIITTIPLAKNLFDDANRAVMTEMEILNSRPVIEMAAERLRSQGLLRNASSDPVPTLQNMLQLTRVEDTLVVRLQAQGSQKDLVAPLVNTLLDVYRAQLAATGDASSQSQLAAAEVELQAIEAKVAEKQRVLEDLRSRANIVSGERDENQTLVQLKGLATALAKATDLEATAAGKVRSIEQAIVQGNRAPQARDHPTVAAIEARLSQAREDWRAMERRFTPQYLDMDPDAVALKARITNLEQQMVSESQRAQQMALADAREELVNARATANSLQQRMMQDKLEVNTFSRDFGQFQSLQEDLKSLTLVRNTAAEKLLTLQATETTRQPHLTILEPATTPDAPSLPLYWRDAGVVVLGSMVLSFLSVWFVEFLNRKETVSDGSATMVFPRPWPVSPVLTPFHANGRTAGQLSHHPEPGQPELQSPVSLLPRELDAAEVQQLLGDALPADRPLLACLLSGLTAEEVVGLQWQHLDIRRNMLQVPGPASRELPLNGPLRAMADATENSASPHVPTDPLFTQGLGRPLDVTDVQTIVTFSAFDADLPEPQSVTPEALRHTYIAFLVRQGLRFSELGALVGRLGTDMLKAMTPLAQSAPPGPRVGLAEVQQLLPALR